MRIALLMMATVTTLAVPAEARRGFGDARRVRVAQPQPLPPLEPVEEAPLARRRQVRPETWVNRSRYHDGNDNRLTVSAPRAELFGRPQATGSVVGILRRGEVVSLVRKSVDGRWLLVDIGGGDVAWLEARAVQPGAAQAPTPVEEPAPVVAVAPSPPAAAPPPAPTPARRQRRTMVISVAEAAAEPPPAATPARNLDDETPANLPTRREPPRRVEAPERPLRGVRVASRSLTGLVSSPAASVEKSVAPPAGANRFDLGARLGVAMLRQRFLSNGTGPMANYEANTTAFAFTLHLGYTRSVGRWFRIGAEGAYTFAGAAGVRYRTADGSDPVLGVQTHVIDATVAPGLHFDVIGGLDIKLRIGLELALNLIDMQPKLALPSDRVIGLTIGGEIAAPALFTFSNCTFGLRAYGAALTPADRAQTAGLEDGVTGSTIGATIGLNASLTVWKGLALGAAYQYGFAVTHSTGPSKRNDSITEADRGTDHHILTLGLAYRI